ncbi:proton-conducting transporter membrane subunit [Escherichia coli]
MMPLHSWLLRAHPAAPSHASALMSGVMVKMGLFRHPESGRWTCWRERVCRCGGASRDGDRRHLRAPGRAVCAGGRQDIKRLLAWSTVENVGIILLAVGVAMVGLSLHDPLLTVVELLGALFHLLNHALFKGLLFLGAGAVLSHFALPRAWKKWGRWRSDAVDSRSMPDWLPHDISSSSAEWFYQRMVHLAVAVLAKWCGSRSATTCGSYCYGNAGSHWWAGSNVLRKNVRYYFLWCAAQYTR